MLSNGKIPVVIAGASGRTGHVIGVGIHQSSDMEITGAIGKRTAGRSLQSVLGLNDLDLVIQSDLADIGAAEAVLVDFTDAASAVPRLLSALERGWDAVVGTTGFTDHHLAMFAARVRDTGASAAFIPNFSVGAWALEQMAQWAVRYFSEVEIIEAHGPAKKDRPSGTARRMAALLAEGLQKDPESIPIHSMRLNGMGAHQTVVFGAPDQVISLRHDVHGRTAYVEGVLSAIRKVRSETGRLITTMSEVWGDAGPQTSDDAFYRHSPRGG